MFDKREIVTKILRELEGNLQTLVRVAHQARADATHEDAKAENKYDTRGLEASYLAGAQAKRASDLEDTIAYFKKMELKNFMDDTPIEATALVQVELETEEQKWFFIVPSQGGMKVEIEGESVQTLSPGSPLGQKLMGRTVGHAFEFKVQGDALEHEITEIW